MPQPIWEWVIVVLVFALAGGLLIWLSRKTSASQVGVDWSALAKLSVAGGRVAAALIAALGGAVALVWLFTSIAGASQGGVDWSKLAKLVVAVGLAFAITAMLRFALAPLVSREPPPQVSPADADVALRSRIAPLVLAIGSAAIIVLAGGLIIAFSILAEGNDALKPKVDVLLNGVFSAVLPVFATWVGTVIAFYFTNESFRQAAQATREAAAGATPAQPKVTERMIPYDKIAKIEEPRATAPSIPMSRVIPMFTPPVTRVIVFDAPSHQPVFIIRSKSPPMPAGWMRSLER